MPIEEKGAASTTRLRIERAAAAAIDAMLVLRSIASEAPDDPGALHAVRAAGREAAELADFCDSWVRRNGSDPHGDGGPTIPLLRLSA